MLQNINTLQQYIYYDIIIQKLVMQFRERTTRYWSALNHISTFLDFPLYTQKYSLANLENIKSYKQLFKNSN